MSYSAKMTERHMAFMHLAIRHIIDNSHEVSKGGYNFRIIQLLSDAIILKPNLAALRLHDIWQ